MLDTDRFGNLRNHHNFYAAFQSCSDEGTSLPL